MSYLEMLENSFEIVKSYEAAPQSRLAYLSDYIFEFTTYDSEMAEAFAVMAIAVCKAITYKKTFEFIEDRENYCTYLLMCNMPFFIGRLDWGSSIRGAWWEYKDSILETTGIYVGQDQVTQLKFTPETWEKFILAVIEFAELPEEKAAAEKEVVEKVRQIRRKP